MESRGFAGFQRAQYTSLRGGSSIAPGRIRGPFLREFSCEEPGSRNTGMLRPVALGVLFLGVAALVLRSPVHATPAVPAPPSSTEIFAANLPRPDHTVLVVMENHSYSDI